MSFQRNRKAVIFLALVGGAILFRFIQTGPFGAGRSAGAPKPLFTAYAFNMYDEGFWGNPRRYYEFSVRSNGGRLLRHIQIPEPPDPVHFREGTGRIMWTPDAKSVSFGTAQNVIWSTPVP